MAQYLICLFPCPFPFVPGVILCLQEQSLLFSPLPLNHSLLCIFLQTNKLGCCLAVIISPLYRWPTCVLWEVMLFDHSSLATFPLACQQLLLEPEPAAIGCTITEQQAHKQSDSLTERECPVYLSECLSDEENGFHLQIRTILCVW